MDAKQAANLMRDAATDEPGISAEEFATALEPFGAVAFDAERRGTDSIPHGDALYAPSNGERATDGELTLALFCALGLPQGPRSVLEDIAEEISLTEAPEEALADLLTNLMHYCHREGIEWFGHDGVSQVALRNFSAESGGAVL